MARAIIMAGGEGARLRPYTAILPKPLMPIGDRPVLDIVIRQLRAADFERVTIATGYLAELIEAFFRDGRSYGVPIDYFREHEPLGTVGALALLGGLDEPFLVMNGDVLTDMDYAAMLEHHVASGAAVTVASTRRHVNISLGVMEFEDVSAPQRVTRYVEKPTLSYEVSMGVYCFAPARPRAHRGRRAARLPRPDPAAARRRRARRGAGGPTRTGSTSAATTTTSRRSRSSRRCAQRLLPGQP